MLPAYAEPKHAITGPFIQAARAGIFANGIDSLACNLPQRKNEELYPVVGGPDARGEPGVCEFRSGGPLGWAALFV